MELFQDYEDLLNAFNARGVKYLLVGGYAVSFYTVPRFTKDMDLWIRPDERNAQKVYRALEDFGAPLIKIVPGDFVVPGTVYQMGVAPVRIDIINTTGGVPFDEAWKNKKTVKYGKAIVQIIGLIELIAVKKAVGRKQDMIDLEKLVNKIPGTKRKPGK
jgi:hypothetical protein